MIPSPGFTEIGILAERQFERLVIILPLLSVVGKDLDEIFKCFPVIILPVSLKCQQSGSKCPEKVGIWMYDQLGLQHFPDITGYYLVFGYPACKQHLTVPGRIMEQRIANIFGQSLA